MDIHTQSTLRYIGVAFVAVAMLFVMAMPVKAQTIEELQALIAELTAQIEALAEADTSTSSTVAYNFTRSLTVGSEGADVSALQRHLIGNGYSIPAGATGYFGAQTQAAVAAWQATHSVAPAVGYFGPISIAKYESLAPSLEIEVTNVELITDEETELTEDDLSGEASLNQVNVQDGDDDNIEEGDSRAMVADLDIKFTNGDAAISRIDLDFDETGSTVEQEPWDTFETIYLYVDGEEVAEMDVDNEDDWLDEDAQTLRISGLNILGEEDEEVTITVAVDVVSSIDGVTGSTEANWVIGVRALRFMDGDGVVTTDTATGDIVSGTTAFASGETAGFAISAEGDDDGLSISGSPNNPDTQILTMEADEESDWGTIFIFEIKADDNGGDITIDTITATTTVSGEEYEDVVSDVELIINGETYTDFTVSSTTAENAVLTFDLDKDVVIESGEEIDATFRMKFNALDGTAGSYGEGQLVKMSTSYVGWEAEGSDDLTAGTQITGAASGENHILQTEGILPYLISTTETKAASAFDGDADKGTYVVKFGAIASEGDVYFDEDVSTITYFVYVDGDEESSATASTTATLNISGADTASVSDYVLHEGETATFTFTLETAADLDSGAARIYLYTLGFSMDDDGAEERTQLLDTYTKSLILN